MAANVKTLKLNRTQIMANAQVMYEVRGMTLDDISQALGVTRVTLGKWKKKGKWLDREAALPEIVELTRQKTIEMLSAKGMPPERAAALLIDGMLNPVENKLTVQRFDRKSGRIKDKVLFKGDPDHKTRHKYNHDYWLLAGQIGNNGKMEVNNNGTGTVNVMVNLPEKRDVG